MRDRFRGRSLKDASFAEAFASIPESACSACWCASTLDFNFLMKPAPRALRALIRRVP